MATGDVAVGAPGAGSSAALQTPTSKRVINDFSIQVATVNGSGLAIRQPGSAQEHFRDGYSGKRKKPFSLQHRGVADLVYHSRQQTRVRRTQTRNRTARGDECRDRARRHSLAANRRRRHLRREFEPQAISRRRHLLSSSFRQANRCGLSEAKLRKLVRNMIYVGVVALSAAEAALFREQQPSI